MRLLFTLSLCSLGWMGCGGGARSSAKPIQLEGKTMGTTYHISYLDSLERNFQTAMDSLLAAFNRELSTYDSTSLISRFNKDSVLLLAAGEGGHLRRNIELSRQVYQVTNGWFNPTVKPLVNYWGFGYQEKRPVAQVDSAVIDALLQLLGMDKISVESRPDQSVLIRKTDRRVQLDVNAIAPGDAADVLGTYLDQKGIHNYMVEIGGEICARGRSHLGTPWRIGINVPHENAQLSDFQAVLELKDQGMATSGNYRNFYEKDGKRYTHTINPKTGYTENNNLLSTTILAPSAALADAYATACMAMGADSAFVWAEAQKDVSAYFIYTDTKTNAIKEKAIRVQFVE